MHRYAISLIVASLLLLAGAYVVQDHSPVSPATSVGTWGTGGIFVDSVPKQLPAGNAQAPVPHGGGSAYTYVSPFGSNNSTLDTAESKNTAEFNAFIADLSRGSQKNVAKNPGTNSEAYSFIPSGFISPLATQTNERTPVQEALYLYGNEIGNSIQGYENAHHDPSLILKNFIEDRSNPDKKAAQKQLGADLSAVGTAMERTENVPTQVAAASLALAHGYEEIGANLAAITDFSRDEDVVHAIEKYNASADRFAQNYVALALAFQAYGVTFASFDSGSVFVLQQAPSL